MPTIVTSTRQVRPLVCAAVVATLMLIAYVAGADMASSTPAGPAGVCTAR